ncbi:hypothetical protein K1W69_26795, partial [Hoeflea sp. WL0058]
KIRHAADRRPRFSFPYSIVKKHGKTIPFPKQNSKVPSRSKTKLKSPFRKPTRQNVASPAATPPSLVALYTQHSFAKSTPIFQLCESFLTDANVCLEDRVESPGNRAFHAC